MSSDFQKRGAETKGPRNPSLRPQFAVLTLLLPQTTADKSLPARTLRRRLGPLIKLAPMESPLAVSPLRNGLETVRAGTSSQCVMEPQHTAAHTSTHNPTQPQHNVCWK